MWKGLADRQACVQGWVLSRLYICTCLSPENDPKSKRYVNVILNNRAMMIQPEVSHMSQIATNVE